MDKIEVTIAASGHKLILPAESIGILEKTPDAAYCYVFLLVSEDIGWYVLESYEEIKAILAVKNILG